MSNLDNYEIKNYGILSQNLDAISDIIELFHVIIEIKLDSQSKFRQMSTCVSIFTIMR